VKSGALAVKPGPEPVDRRTGRMVQALLAGVVGLAFVWLVVSQVNPVRVGAMLRSIRPVWIVLGLTAFCIDFLLRAVRFWMMLRFATGRPLALAPAIAPFIASFGISDILPFRAGDAFRVYWFNRRFAIPVGKLIGAMIVERVMDLVSVIALGAGFVAGSPTLLPAVFSRQGWILLVMLLVASGGLLFVPRWLASPLQRVLRNSKSTTVRTLGELVGSTADAIASMGSPVRVAGLLISSIALWIIEFVVFLCAWASLGGGAGDWLKPGLAFAAATLGTLVPALPGHFGSFEYFGVNGFLIAGVDATRATAVTLTAHLMLWAPTALFAIGWLVFGARRSRGEKIFSGQ
jgi:uncharacterized protein (TIRG00374 family)